MAENGLNSHVTTNNGRYHKYFPASPKQLTANEDKKWGIKKTKIQYLQIIIFLFLLTYKNIWQ